MAINSFVTWGALTRRERQKVALLSIRFFLTIATLWVLKPIRNASLLAHLGAAELPYVRLATVSGVSIPMLLAVALAAILIWVLCANQLGLAYAWRAERRVRHAA